ncbi:hypothetical protein BaRGS_00026361 [Batillaria attramentaria]|uniref:Uncharacterized protein n=1 Tax=Batillaria attramentaria TaxID=370345 RepID=A0ABD0K5B0_9CAEN
MMTAPLPRVSRLLITMTVFGTLLTTTDLACTDELSVNYNTSLRNWVVTNITDMASRNELVFSVRSCEHFMLGLAQTASTTSWNRQQGVSNCEKEGDIWHTRENKKMQIVTESFWISWDLATNTLRVGTGTDVGVGQFLYKTSMNLDINALLLASFSDSVEVVFHDCSATTLVQTTKTTTDVTTVTTLETTTGATTASIRETSTEMTTVTTPGTSTEMTTVTTPGTSTEMTTIITPETSTEMTTVTTPEPATEMTTVTTPETPTEMTTVTTPETPTEMTTVTTPETPTEMTTVTTPETPTEMTTVTTPETPTEMTTVTTPETPTEMTTITTPETSTELTTVTESHTTSHIAPDTTGTTTGITSQSTTTTTTETDVTTKSTSVTIIEDVSGVPTADSTTGIDFEHSSEPQPGNPGMGNNGEGGGATHTSRVYPTTPKYKKLQNVKLTREQKKCRCALSKTNSNQTQEEKEREKSDAAAKIVKDLTVPRTNMSSTVRRKTSAKDSRPTATTVGSVGAFLCLLPLVLVISLDVLNVGMRLFEKRKLHRMQ